MSVSHAVRAQLPEWVVSDSPLFARFLELYYSYLEQEGQPLHYIDHALEQKDIDTVSSDYNGVDFLSLLLKTIIPALPENTDRQVSVELLVKHITELYRAKGTEAAIRFVFQALFNLNIGLDYGYKYVLRSSDNEINRSTVVILFGPHASESLGYFLEQTEPVYASSYVENLTLLAPDIYKAKLCSRRHVGQFVDGSTVTFDGKTARLLNVISEVRVSEKGSGYEHGMPVEGDGRNLTVDEVSADGVKNAVILRRGFGHSAGTQIDVVSEDGYGKGAVAEITAVDGYGAQIEILVGAAAGSVNASIVNAPLRVGGGYNVGDLVSVRGQVMRVLGVSDLYLYKTVVDNAGHDYTTAYALFKMSSQYERVECLVLNGRILAVPLPLVPTDWDDATTVYINGSGAYGQATVTSKAIGTLTVTNGGINYHDPRLVWWEDAAHTIPATVNDGTYAFTQNSTTHAITTITKEKSGYFNYSNGTVLYFTVKELHGDGAVVRAVVGGGFVLAESILEPTPQSTIEHVVPVETITGDGEGAVVFCMHIPLYPKVIAPGINYIQPIAEVTNTVGRNAELIPHISDGVISEVSVGSGGGGFNVKRMRIDANALQGSGAILTPVLNSSNVLVDIEIENGGFGYVTGALTVIGYSAARTSTTIAGSTSVSVTDVTNIETGMKVTGSTISGTRYVAAVYSATNTIVLDSSTGVSTGVSTLTFATLPATANVTGVKDGAITSVTVKNPGTGYLPMLPIEVTGSGIGADMRVVFDPTTLGVHSVEILDSGSGYDDTTTISISLEGLEPPELTLTSTETGVVADVAVTASGYGYNDIEPLYFIIFEPTNPPLTLTSQTKSATTNGTRTVVVDTTDLYVGMRVKGSTLALSTDYFVVDIVDAASLLISSSDGVDIGTANLTFIPTRTGKQAKAMPILENGAITDIIILDGGYGYETGATWILYGGGGGGFAGTLVVNDVTKVIDGFNISNSGTGYKLGTKVRLIGDGSGATAGVEIDYGISALKIEDGGAGYQHPRALVYSETSSNAVITLSATEGVITSYSIREPGSYEHSPPFVIAYEDSGGATFDVILVGDGVDDITVVSNGRYLTPPTITIVGDGANATAHCTLNALGFISSVIVDTPGSGYSYAFAFPSTGVPTTPALITAIQNFGIKKTPLDTGGSGYTNCYAVIEGDGYGARAEVTITGRGGIGSVNMTGNQPVTEIPQVVITDAANHGAISAVTILEPGSGYRQYPRATIPTKDNRGLLVVGDSTGFEPGQMIYISGLLVGIAATIVSVDHTNHVMVVDVSEDKVDLAFAEGDLITNDVNITDVVVYIRRSDASVLLRGDGIGGVKSVIATDHSYDLEEEPPIRFPLVMTTTDHGVAFKLEECVYVPSYSYPRVTHSRESVTTAGSPTISVSDTLNLYKGMRAYGDGLDTLTSYWIENINSTASEVTLQTSSGITSVSGTVHFESHDADYAAGPHGKVFKADQKKNLLVLYDTNIHTTPYIIETENEYDLELEWGDLLAHEDNSILDVGTTLRGALSGSEVSLLHVNRAEGYSELGAEGRYEDQFITNRGMPSEATQMLHNGVRIQDYSYFIASNMPYNEYKGFLRALVHPAGYRAFGDLSMVTELSLDAQYFARTDTAAGIIISDVFIRSIEQRAIPLGEFLVDMGLSTMGIIFGINAPVSYSLPKTLDNIHEPALMTYSLLEGFETDVTEEYELTHGSAAFGVNDLIYVGTDWNSATAKAQVLGITGTTKMRIVPITGTISSGNTIKQYGGSVTASVSGKTTLNRAAQFYDPPHDDYWDTLMTTIESVADAPIGGPWVGDYAWLNFMSFDTYVVLVSA